MTSFLVGFPYFSTRITVLLPALSLSLGNFSRGIWSCREPSPTDLLLEKSQNKSSVPPRTAGARCVLPSGSPRTFFTLPLQVCRPAPGARGRPGLALSEPRARPPPRGREAAPPPAPRRPRPLPGRLATPARPWPLPGPEAGASLCPSRGSGTCFLPAAPPQHPARAEGGGATPAPRNLARLWAGGGGCEGLFGTRPAPPWPGAGDAGQRGCSAHPGEPPRPLEPPGHAQGPGANSPHFNARCLPAQELPQSMGLKPPAENTHRF